MVTYETFDDVGGWTVLALKQGKQIGGYMSPRPGEDTLRCYVHFGPSRWIKWWHAEEYEFCANMITADLPDEEACIAMIERYAPYCTPPD